MNPPTVSVVCRSDRAKGGLFSGRLFNSISSTSSAATTRTASRRTSPTSSCTSLKSGVNTVSIPSFKVRPLQSFRTFLLSSLQVCFIVFGWVFISLSGVSFKTILFIGVKLSNVTEAGARPNFTHSAAHLLQLDNLSQSFRLKAMSRIPAENRTGVPSSEHRSLSSAQSTSLMRAATAQRHLLFPPFHNPAPSLSLLPVVNYSPPLCQHYYYPDVFSFLLFLSFFMPQAFLLLVYH